MITNAKIISIETNPEDYHKKEFLRCTPEYPISSSDIREFILCPAKYKSGGEEETENNSLLFGSLLDCKLLTPKQFDSRFAIQPEYYTDEKGNEKQFTKLSNTCKKWIAEQGNKTIITVDKLFEVQQAIDKIKEDETIASFIKQSDTQVFISASWVDEDTKLGIPIKALIDILPREDSEYSSCLADLKSTRDASPINFNRSVFSFGYHIQGAFYIDMINAVKESRDTFCFIVQENKKPFQVGKRILHVDFLDMGRNEYQAALRNYCKCLKSGFFPSYDDTDEAVQGWSTCFPEPWMEGKTSFGVKYKFKE
jgi:exodeoxyribonuclease VIII